MKTLYVILLLASTWVHAQHNSDLICDKGIFPTPGGPPKEAVTPSLTEEDTAQLFSDQPSEEACPATLKQPQQQTLQK